VTVSPKSELRVPDDVALRSHRAHTPILERDTHLPADADEKHVAHLLRHIHRHLGVHWRTDLNLGKENLPQGWAQQGGLLRLVLQHTPTLASRAAAPQHIQGSLAGAVSERFPPHHIPRVPSNTNIGRFQSQSYAGKDRALQANPYLIRRGVSAIRFAE
jgi:hypothetical protein